MSYIWTAAEQADGFAGLERMIGQSWQNLYCIAVSDNDYLIEAMLGEQAEREWAEQRELYRLGWSEWPKASNVIDPPWGSR